MSSSPTQSKYRSDIDGLRALAILPVIFYHLNLKPFTGGYVGVDVFFVISGYLITGLILPEIKANRFSIINFYVRRSRRIFPALFAMFAVAFVVALIFYFPSETHAFRESLTAATLFVSNIYFYFTQNYFAPAADTQPLLHTWSLAVEEQFYVIFPWILLLLSRFRLSIEKRILAVAAIASFAASAWMAYNQPTGAFYLPQSRAWELSIGALLAMGAFPIVRARWLGEAMGLLGLLLIAASTLLYSDDTPFPGIAAAAPCIGAALLIHSGEAQKPLAARLLSLWPVRFIGLISYSLYIWHWPIDVFYQYIWGVPSGMEKIAILAATFLVAIASWHFVERPFRVQPYRIGPRGILQVSGIAMALLLAGAAVLAPVSAARWNLPEGAERVLAYLQYDSQAQMRAGLCFLDSEFKDFTQFNQDACLKVLPDRKNALLIGDSQAADLWVGLSALDPQVNVMQATASGCRPVIGGTGSARCKALMDFIFRTYLPAHKLDAVILSARWTSGDSDDVAATVAAIRGFASKVIVLGPRAEYWHPLPRDLALSEVRNDAELAARDRRPLPRKIDAQLSQKLQGSGAQFFSIYQAMCPAETCMLYADDGSPLQYDYGHFTSGGAKVIARLMQESGVFRLE